MAAELSNVRGHRLLIAQPHPCIKYISPKEYGWHIVLLTFNQRSQTLLKEMVVHHPYVMVSVVNHGVFSQVQKQVYVKLIVRCGKQHL